MQDNSKVSALILGAFLFLGLAALGYILGNAAIEFKEYERTVTVKGLSEREYEVDIIIWPIRFTKASNDLGNLYFSGEKWHTDDDFLNILEKGGVDVSKIISMRRDEIINEILNK